MRSRRARAPRDERRRVSDRLWFLATAILGLYLVFLARLFHLQVIEGAHYAQLVERSRLVTEVLAPRRGRILDRHGTAIADTRAVYNLGITFAELELGGRARRELPFWRLDEKRLDAFLADLAGRVRLVDKPTSLRSSVLRELLDHPAVAVRDGGTGVEVPLGLVALPRTGLSSLHPDSPEDSGFADLARLAESDLLSDDPRDALERELASAWTKEVTILYEDEFQALCQNFDTEMAANEGAGAGSTPENSQSIVDPFVPSFALTVPDTITPSGDNHVVNLAMRIIAPERRTQAEATLARTLGESQPVIHELVERALRAARIARHSQDFYYGARTQAEQIAPLMAQGELLTEVQVADVPGARERVLIVQGDPPDGEGALTQICQRIGANIGASPDIVQVLLTKYAERIRAITCERDYRVHHMALDMARVDRLADGLARALTGLGRPATVLDIDAALAKVRRAADKEWTGKTRYNALSLVPDIPHGLAVRLVGENGEPPRDLLGAYQDAGAPLPGLVVQLDVGRSYPFPGSCVHFLGTLGRVDSVTEGDERVGLEPGTLVGVSGLEQLYDAQLRGVAGEEERIHTPDGIRSLRKVPPKEGDDLVTQLDMEMQTTAEDSLDHYYELAQQLGSASDAMDKARQIGLNRAGFCMIDCQTGGILALATSPRYRIEDLRARFDQLVKDKAEPLIDHAAVPEQPPGSSFKILTALCCLEHEVISPAEEFYCQGYMTMYRGHKVLRDHAPAGTYDLPHAIQVSSNVYFATIGARLKPDWLCDYAHMIGLGSINAVDVQEQRKGRLPTPGTLARLFRDSKRKWQTSDTWFMSIGQFATASPLQCVAISAAVANGGHIVRPYLVQPKGGAVAPAVQDLHIRKDYLDGVRRGMELVTDNEEHATGKLLVLEGDAEGIKVAAKTGTSEWGTEAGRERGDNPDNAWMIGYAPAEHPVVAFACFIYCGTFGGAACTPVVKRELEAYFHKYGPGGHNEPRPPPPPTQPAAASNAPAATPAGGNADPDN